MNTVKLRTMMLLASLCLALLYVLSLYLAPCRDLYQLCAATGLCCLWTLYRGTHKTLRRQAFRYWHAYGGMAMGTSHPLRIQIKAAFGWAVLDALWLSLMITASLPWA